MLCNIYICRLYNLVCKMFVPFVLKEPTGVYIYIVYIMYNI